MCDTDKSEKFIWKPFLRQLLVCSGAWMFYFMLGLCMGAPTVVVPQLRMEANSTDAVSEDMASWLPAVLKYSGLPWIFILPILVTYIGRKLSYVIVCISCFIGFVIFYNSVDVYQILISELLQGVVTGSYLTISIVVITEFTSPKYRGIFLTIKSASFFWGILVANATGTFFHWRKIPMVGLVCASYNLVTVIFWPESPVWLATKKRYDKCAATHRWLKGSDVHSEKELQRLISHYENVNTNISLKSRLSDTCKTLSTRSFYKPVMFAVLLLLLYTFSGKLVCTVYAIDIIKKITNNTSVAYSGMLILDGVTVASMYVGCALSKCLKRRTLLLGASFVGVSFLFLISLYLYLIQLKVIEEDNYISIVLLGGYSIAIGCGPLILSTSIAGELIPLHSRGLSMCATALTYKFINGTFIKLAPYIFKILGIHGMFCLFGVSSSILLVLIYLYIPETKDKTSQEISELLSGTKSPEELSELISDKAQTVVILPSK